MQIQVQYDNDEDVNFNTIQEAQDDIEEKNADNIAVNRIVEVDEDGNEYQEYGCEWSVKVVPL